jgi:IclR family pca regulon transcriptional regulator
MDSTLVQALQRGLAVLQTLSEAEPAQTPAEVASATGLAATAARRFLLTLVDLKYVTVDRRRFRLSPRILELGQAYLASLQLPAVARDHLRALVDGVEESASIGVLDGTDVVYVAHVPARRIMSVSITVGARDPALATSLGRVLLAARRDRPNAFDAHRLPAITPQTVADVETMRVDLARVERNGFSLVDQELEEGLRAIAVPLRNGEGRVSAALNLAVPARRWSAAAMKRELLPRLQAAAEAIEADAAASIRRTRTSPVRRIERFPHDGRGSHFVQSVQRGLSVVCAFDAQSQALTLSEVAHASGLPRAAARRFLLTLVEAGYVRVDGRLFELTPRVLDLGRPFLDNLTLPELTEPHLRALVRQVQESASVAALDGAEIVYIAHVPARRVMAVTVPVGARDPAFATALGRALLGAQPDTWLDAFLDEVGLRRFTSKTIASPLLLRRELERVRELGYALVDEEFEDGLVAVAAPIRNSNEDVIAAVNLAVHASRWSAATVRTDLLPHLLDTASAIERDVRAAASATHAGLSAADVTRIDRTGGRVRAPAR